MKARIFVGGSLTVVLATVGLLVASSRSDAGRGYSERSLRGDYQFHQVEIREDSPGNFTFCDLYGTATFDGAGTATGSTTRRCSDQDPLDPPITDPGMLTYVVYPDGEVLLEEVGTGKITRGQIVDNGKMVLIDATTRRDDVWVQHGFAVKR